MQKEHTIRSLPSMLVWVLEHGLWSHWLPRRTTRFIKIPERMYTFLTLFPSKMFYVKASPIMNPWEKIMVNSMVLYFEIEMMMCLLTVQSNSNIQFFCISTELEPNSAVVPGLASSLITRETFAEFCWSSILALSHVSCEGQVCSMIVCVDKEVPRS